MKSKSYVIDRLLHWSAALLLLFMLMNLASQMHNADWQVKGQLEHRQDAVELHAMVGVVLLLLTAMRMVFPYLTKTEIPRITPKSKGHAFFIKVTHLALYMCIFALAITGIVMLNHHEIPLTVFGNEFLPDADKTSFYSTFADYHQIHMLLKNAIWWLIGIHFVGILYAKR